MKKRIFIKKVTNFLKYIRTPKNEFGFLVCSLLHKHHPDILPTNIFIDDGNHWINLCNKKIILFQIDKNENRNWEKIIPMTIEDNPQILVENIKIELSNSELGKIKNFVSNNQKALLDLSNNKIDHTEFFEKTGLNTKKPMDKK